MSTATTSMQVKRQDLNEATAELEIICSADQVQAGFKSAIRQLGKKVRVPGFRPGQAPPAMIERAIPQGDLYEAAFDAIVQKVFPEALKSADVASVGQPSLTPVKLEKETSECEFTVKVPLAPKIEIGEYKGLSIVKDEITVTEEEVDRQLEDFRRRSGKQEKIIDRAIQEGDMAVVNIKVDGEEGDGRTFMTIVGQTFKGLDETILGMRAEEIRPATLEFPANFQDKEWASTTKSCHVTIRSISSVQVPDLDDTFAKSLQADDLKDLRAKVKDRIREAKEEMGMEMVNEQLLDQIRQKSTVVVATTTYEGIALQRMRELATELGKQKKSLEDYAKERDMTVEELNAALEQEAKVHVERAVMIESIFRQEGMSISDEVANQQFLKMLQANEIPEADIPKFVQQFGAQIREEVIYRGMHSMVLDLLRENAVEGKAPAKAKAAKAKTETKAEAPSEEEAPKAETKKKAAKKQAE